MPRAVLDMADRRPIWAMPDWVPERLRATLPPSWELVVPGVVTDGLADGASRVAPEVLEAVRDAEIYLGYGIHESLLEAGQSLEWVHTGSAGVGKSLTPAMLASPVVFTNSAGVHAEPMAETVLAMILHFMRGLDFALEGQRRHEWRQEPFYDADAPIVELADAVVGIVGFGGVGKEVARRAASLGARVIGLKRTEPKPGDADLEPVGGGRSLADRIQLVRGPEGLERLTAQASVLVVSAPETEETKGLIDAAALARLPRGAIVVNVARGSLIDEKAMLDALSAGRLRGAGLDVFWEEPVPESHPVWRLPNVVLTPHVSPVTRGFWRRETDLIVRNMERYLGGEPPRFWENVVDKQAGY